MAKVDLIGVPHHQAYANAIMHYITSTYNQGVNSLLVELPKNWLEFVKKGLTADFFHPLADAFDSHGTRIIYGDRERRVPRSVKLYKIVSLFDVVTGLRNRSLERSINEEEPQVALVGRKHADYLREVLPDVHYTAIERDWRNYPRFPAESLIHKIQGEPNNPDRLIILQG